MENVPGLARDELFRKFVKGLGDMEYGVDSGVLDCSKFGTPQRRRRLVVVAAQGMEPSLVLSGGEDRSVRDAIGAIAGSAGHSGDPLHDHGERRSPEIQSIIERIPSDGGCRADLGEDAQLECHRVAAARGDGWGRDCYGRMAWDSPAPTITGGCVNPGKGRFLHPEKNRAMTLREALLLQGFPEDYRLSMTRGKYAAADLAGNAIPPPFVKAQAQALRHLATSGGFAP